MRNVRCKIAYDGSCFHGWQRQDGFPSVQEALEEALLELTGDSVTVYGAGRTDTGVHALGQVANFHVETRLDDDRLRHALNAHLPRGVSVVRSETCGGDFHARFSAKGKRYAYFTRTSRFRPPFGRAYAHWSNHPLDFEAMKAAARVLIGRHDFAAFSSTGSERKTTVRTVRSLHFIPRRDYFGLVIEGDGFLYNMVRIIAGTLLDVGRGRLDRGATLRALETLDRDELGATAPPEGLYLVSVLYPEPTFPGRDAGPRGAAGLFSDSRLGDSGGGKP